MPSTTDSSYFAAQFNLASDGEDLEARRLWLRRYLNQLPLDETSQSTTREGGIGVSTEETAENAIAELDFYRLKRGLKRLITQLSETPISYGEGEGVVVNRLSIINARAFIDYLSRTYLLPKVAPDEDGIMFVWDQLENPTIVTVVGNELYAVAGACSKDSTHIGPLEFDRVQIPREVLRYIPTRQW
jgi:hypothetical protein